MTFKMTKMAAAVLMTGFSVVASAAGGIGTITQIQITGGSISNGSPGVGVCGAGGPFGSFQCITAGPVINTNDGLFEAPAGGLLGLMFFNSPVTTFTAATATGAAPSTSGNPLSGTDEATSITLDLGSFYANWSGTNFLQAPSNDKGALNPLVTGTYDSTTGAFDMSWTSYVTTAPFAGSTFFWHINGFAATVPEASTYGMMLAGVGLVGFMARRRRV